MERLSVQDAPCGFIKLVYLQPQTDVRGSLTRVFCRDELSSLGWNQPVAQINQSFTQQRGTVRGMHCQTKPHSEMKLITCIRGAVFDVVIDVRENSPTFLKWQAEELSDKDNKALFIPEGVAHGFQTLSDNVELLYIHSTPYEATAEFGIHPLDPLVAINWPNKVINMSSKDSRHKSLDVHFRGLEA
jgi:dTDP-4-dehydrorhamnose 3,5-epimerase